MIFNDEIQLQFPVDRSVVYWVDGTNQAVCP